MWEYLYGIGGGVASAVIYAMTAYMKAVVDNKEEFDYVKFGTTIVIGAIVGVVMSVFHVTYDVATTWLTTIGIVVIVEKLIKSLYQKYFVKSRQDKNA
jgi:hypothetical protein